VAELLVVTGPPGAGKSTAARPIADRHDLSVLLRGDDVFAFLARGAVAPWLPEAAEQNEVVLQAAAAAAGTFARGGFTVVYDGVVGPWSLASFAAAAGADRLSYAVLLPPLERCLQRVAARTGHGFTDPDATRHMHRQFAEADVAPRHLLTDLPDDPADVVELLLARLADGRLRVSP